MEVRGYHVGGVSRIFDFPLHRLDYIHGMFKRLKFEGSCHLNFRDNTRL